MARRTLKMETLEARDVPSITPVEEPKSDTPVVEETTTGEETVQTLEPEVEATSAPAYPPVEFGTGNFQPLPVGSKYVLVSGLRTGEAGLYTFDASGNLVDTGKTYTPFPGSSNRGTSVRGAVGDVNGDGTADLAFVSGTGSATQLRVIDGKSGNDLTPAQTVFGNYFYGGSHVTIADVDSDGTGEVIVTPDTGGGPRVRVYHVNSTGTLTSKVDFFGIDDVTFRGGATVAVADMTGDGKNELIVAAGLGGGSRVAVYSMTTGQPVKLVSDFFALTGDAANLRSGISLSAGDLNGDGYADLVVGTPNGGGPQVIVLDGKAVLTESTTAANNPLASFFAFDSRNRNGVRVAVKDADGDGKADIIAGTGEGAVTNMTGFKGASVMASPFAATADTYVDPFRQVKNAGRSAAGVAVN